jgi:hypothetical protein
MITFTKEAIAMIQLNDAIKLYNDARYVSAITLAGAAEEIFARLLEEESRRRSLSLASAEDTEQFMFESIPKLITEKNYHIQRSRVRNELKHHGNKWSQGEITDDFEYTALIHIAGAIINYKMANEDIPDEVVIQEFCQKQGIN